MAQPIPQTLEALRPLLAPVAPRGWRVLSTEGPEGIVFRGPTGLTVAVLDLVENEGVEVPKARFHFGGQDPQGMTHEGFEGAEEVVLPATEPSPGERTIRRIILSRSSQWPARADIELTIRHFLGENRPYTLAQIHGLGPLAIRIEHREGQGSMLESERIKAEVSEAIDAANERRERSRMKESVLRVEAPAGWRRRPSPMGALYDRDGLCVMISEKEQDGERWALISVSRTDRPPTLTEATEAADALLPGHGPVREPPRDERLRERKLLFVECRYGR
jgi:hypothetical protein